MNITLITPGSAQTISGNRITALRIGRILKQLGHRLAIQEQYDDKPCDLMIALHALRSFESIKKFKDKYPDLPLIVVLTGTDLYHYIHTDSNAQQSLELATRLVVLQERALDELEKRFHIKTRVIYQSATRMRRKAARSADEFKVCVIANLRPEKDPLRTAIAARKLPASSRVKVVHIGRALDARLEKAALAEIERNPRYCWPGELSHREARLLLASSHLLSITSRMEGSSNALCEALASSVPVVASKIPGLVGTLGEDYPGYFPAGDTRALTRLLWRAESEAEFYRQLEEHCARRAPLVDPLRERDCWQRLIQELS